MKNDVPNMELKGRNSMNTIRNRGSGAPYQRNYRRFSAETGNLITGGDRYEPKVINDLSITVEDTRGDVAADIASKLHEYKQNLILRIVEVIGKRKAIKLFYDAQQIENSGGMTLINGHRRRTPGGVYMFVVKHDDDISREQKNKIFLQEKQLLKQKKFELQRVEMLINCTEQTRAEISAANVHAYILRLVLKFLLEEIVRYVTKWRYQNSLGKGLRMEFLHYLTAFLDAIIIVYGLHRLYSLSSTVLLLTILSRPILPYTHSIYRNFLIWSIDTTVNLLGLLVIFYK